MEQIVELAATNLLSPMVLFFVVGFMAAIAGTELTIPEAIAKGLSIYLLLAIGFKGGVDVAAHGLDATLLLALVTGIVLSAIMPILAFGMLRAGTRLSRIDAAAVAGHYGSISIITFVAATSILEARGFASEGYMVAVAAAMEAPAIATAIFLAGNSRQGVGGSLTSGAAQRLDHAVDWCFHCRLDNRRRRYGSNFTLRGDAI